MVRKKGTWLFWVIADILAEKEEEHNRWYNRRAPG